MYFSALNFPYEYLNFFSISLLRFSDLLHCEHISLYVTGIVITVTLIPLSANSNNWVTLGFASVIFYYLRSGYIFMVPYMSRNFVFYPGHCKYSMVEILDYVISTKESWCFVLGNSQLAWSQTANFIAWAGA